MPTAIRRKPGRPPLVENRRGMILDHAARLFATVGFETASLRELAEQMGVSKATVYHYFQTKQEIYDAIIVETLRDLHASAMRALDGGGPAQARLHRFMLNHAAFFERNYWAFSTILVGFGGMHSPMMRDEALQWRDRYEALLRRIVEEGAATGEFRMLDPVVTARAVLSMLNWMARWFRPDGAKRAEEIAEEYYALLVGGLLPAGGSQPPANRGEELS